MHSLSFSYTLQVNHLCPFFLTLELLPVITETTSTSGDGRILFVSSGAHRRGFGTTFNPENLNSEIEYSRMATYPNTKLYNVSAQLYRVYKTTLRLIASYSSVRGDHVLDSDRYAIAPIVVKKYNYIQIFVIPFPKVICFLCLLLRGPKQLNCPLNAIKFMLSLTPAELYDIQ